jgi:hypothetical protein
MVRPSRRMVRTERTYLQRRLGLAAAENVSRREGAAVRRVLELLSDESLAAAAAAAARSTSRVTVECGVLDQVWDDPRIAARINQLTRQGIEVARERVMTRYGEAELTRERLVVTF